MEPTTSASSATLIKRHFTKEGIDPYDDVQWEVRDAWTPDSKYYVPDIEAPAFWSQNAVNITSKLYLANGDYTEKSIKQLINRIANKITLEGIKGGYFGDVEWVEGAGPLADRSGYASEQADIFEAELKYILLHQRAAFNSPVWFNVGRKDRPQYVSACFILGVDDNTQSIMETSKREAYIFKGGSGSGFNVSRIRGSMEALSTGGTASGPVSFMRLWDAGAGTFKSGGTTRRAAKLVRMDADHPDIRDFIEAKPREEERMEILIKAGLNLSMDEEGERNVAECTSFQNANVSVGATDQFMEMATNPSYGKDGWALKARKTGEVIRGDDARELLDLIAQAAWKCADPGMQFDTTINNWHTTPQICGEDTPIRSSNPCGEYLHVDDSSCNLASINVLKFLNDDGSFDTEGYQHTVDVMATAMDICVSFADFPDEKIAERTRSMRQLGLGYSNMGAAIMAQGMAYDSDQARDFAAAVTAMSTGRTYRQSAIMAERLGPFEYFEENREPMLKVIEQHMKHLPMMIDGMVCDERAPQQDIWSAAHQAWHSARDRGMVAGFRNAQASVIAPAGTTSYLLDCDTTGIEPAFNLVSHKELAGGGSMVIVIQSAKRAAELLGGYSEENLVEMTNGDFSSISDEDRAIFHGANEISVEGHIKMLAAVQPFVSGGISKTINMPEETTWQEIRNAYVMAWKLGCKSLALYRNNSKVRQPLSHKAKDQVGMISVGGKTLPGTASAAEIAGAMTPHAEDQYEGPVGPERKRMPRERDMIGHKFNVGGHEGYIIAGMYEDGTLGEIFLEDIGKEGSHVRGMANAFAIAFSIALQYGTPLETLVRKYTNMDFEPHGPTEEPLIPFARSIPDYIARWLAARFLGPDIHAELGIMTDEVKKAKILSMDVTEAVQASINVAADGSLELDHQALQGKLNDQLGRLANGHTKPSSEDLGPLCGDCGGIMHRAGSCYTCPRCGNTTGCG